MNIKITIEYKGTAYSGWQRQVGVRTIQEEIEKALLIFVSSKLKLDSESEFQLEHYSPNLIGSGRTDAGVHAKGQVASFFWPDSLDLNKKELLKGINGLTAPDIAVVEISRVETDFHPRKSALSKTYSYQILHREAPPALDAEYCWHLRDLPCKQTMFEAAKIFLGQHDFSQFRASDCNAKSTVRTIFESGLTETKDHLMTYSVSGNGFLKNQVRFMIGFLVAIGQGRLNIEVLQQVLEENHTRPNFVLAPARGLFLASVVY